MTRLTQKLNGFVVILVAAVVVSVVMSVQMATAAPAPAAPAVKVVPSQPAIFCNAPTWHITANSGWVNTLSDSVYIYAQVWYLIDGTNGNFCDQVISKGGLWFRATYTTCRNVTLYLDQAQYPWHTLDVVSRSTICGSNGSSYQFWGNAVSSCGYNSFEAAIFPQVGNGASVIGSTPSC
jgi:hypothetical protein